MTSKAAATAATTRSKGGKGKKAALGVPKVKFTIDCQKPCEDHVIDPRGLERFLKSHIKVDKKLNNLGDRVNVSRERTKVFVNAELPFSKRYLKYLTKKYLKKQLLRDFLRVVSSKETVYELRYFQLPTEDENNAS